MKETPKVGEEEGEFVWVSECGATGEAGEYFAKMEEKLRKAYRERLDEFVPLLENPQAPAGLLRKMGEVKRYVERWMADSEFRAKVAEDANAAGWEMGLAIRGEEIRYIYDAEYNRKKSQEAGWVAPLIVQQYRAWCCEKILHRERIRNLVAVPQEPRHAAWRARQMERVRGQLGAAQYRSIVHAPVAIELSDGCSVGCWFCGVSSSKKKSDFLYTPENARLWREVLGGLREVLGEATAAGFCYWATDPLDNPDYEKFCLDFAEICGKFPQTTTAQAQKHIERVRKLLPLSRAHGATINRFSILSFSILQKIYEAFSPEELLHVELVTQNEGARTMQSNSGRARNSAALERKAAKVEEGLPENWKEVPGTIACVSGFLVNMVKRTVKLVTPAPSDERWPDGHWVYEEGRFEGAEEFRTLVCGMIERHMSEMLSLGTRARFRRDLVPQFRAGGFDLQAWGAVATFSYAPGVERIARSLVEGRKTVQEVIFEAEDFDGISSGEALMFLNHLYDQGLLDEEPVSPIFLSPQNQQPNSK